MTCELCGRESKGCRSALVDGVRMMLCPDCIKYGEGVQEAPKVLVGGGRLSHRGVKKPARRDIYEKMGKELVSNWSEVIKQARVKKGYSREELGFKIGERTVTIAKIENGDLRPSDKMVEKLEKELGISLLEEVKKVSAPTRSSGALTLGDFIRHEE